MENFTEKELVAFGSYMVGYERQNNVIAHPEFDIADDDQLYFRLTTVSHADVENFKHELKGQE
jgi:hypothetical protein